MQRLYCQIHTFYYIVNFSCFTTLHIKLNAILCICNIDNVQKQFLVFYKIVLVFPSIFLVFSQFFMSTVPSLFLVFHHGPLDSLILEFCPEHNSKSNQATDLKFHRQIDLEGKSSAQEPYLQASYFWSNCSLMIFILEFCLEHNFKTMQVINMKLHMQIDLIEEKCGAQEP